MRKFIFGTLLPICIGALLGLLLSPLLSGCASEPTATGGYDGGTGPTFVSRPYRCTMSGTVTMTNMSNGAAIVATTTYTDTLVIFEPSNNLLALSGPQLPYYEIVFLDDTAGTVEYRPQPANPTQSAITFGLFRVQYATAGMPASWQHHEVFPDHTTDVALTGTCAAEGI